MEPPSRLGRVLAAGADVQRVVGRSLLLLARGEHRQDREAHLRRIEGKETDSG